MGYSPWGHKESNMTEQLTLSLFFETEQGCSRAGTYVTLHERKTWLRWTRWA